MYGSQTPAPRNTTKYARRTMSAGEAMRRVMARASRRRSAGIAVISARRRDVPHRELAVVVARDERATRAPGEDADRRAMPDDPIDDRAVGEAVDAELVRVVGGRREAAVGGDRERGQRGADGEPVGLGAGRRIEDAQRAVAAGADETVARERERLDRLER